MSTDEDWKAFQLLPEDAQEELFLQGYVELGVFRVSGINNKGKRIFEKVREPTNEDKAALAELLLGENGTWRKLRMG